MGEDRGCIWFFFYNRYQIEKKNHLRLRDYEVRLYHHLELYAVKTYNPKITVPIELILFMFDRNYWFNLQNITGPWGNVEIANSFQEGIEPGSPCSTDITT